MATKRLEIKFRKFFNIPRKGENYEFRSGLVSQYADERKDTIQRVIAAMTVGKDVSALFPDVLKNIATHDLEQKKLVYLYLMNYAKTHPELVILATNTFVKDAEDPNPLVRALAIRTMGCIRVDKMVDYMSIPLKRTLKDDNPYVRKTAAICVAKLFDLNPKMCMEQGFLDYLTELVDDSNQMVVANAVSALIEISKATNAKVLNIDSKILKKLLMTLNECTEWGRISILTALADYDAQDVGEVQHIIEKVSPQLQHENPAVVLSSIKVLIKQLDKIPNDQSDNILKRLSSPLCSLLTTAPEIQYVALRNIRILLEKYPKILDRDLRAFFVKYNDPLYLKLEKIEILVRISNDENCMLLLSELREYSMEVDIELVNRSIKGIGQLAIKIEKSSKKCIEVLYELFINRPEYVVEQIIIVIQNILRRYPKEYLSTVITIIADLKFEDLSSADSLSSYIWIIGQYSREIPHLEDKLTLIVDQFQDFEPLVQSASLTAIVKISLTKPTPKISQLLQKLLNEATTEIENADVRDKAYLYWRILSTDNPTLQNEIILNKLPTLKSTIEEFSPLLLDELLDEICNLGSVYFKPASSFVKLNDNDKAFVKSSKLQNKKLEELQQMAKHEIVNNAVKAENLLDFDDNDDGEEEYNDAPFENSTHENSTNILKELNDLFSGLTPAAGANPETGSLATTNSTHSNSLSNYLDPNTPKSNGDPSVTKKTNDILDLF